MPLPIVANLYLARLVWANAGAPRHAINDLYFHDDAGGHTGTDVYNAMAANVTHNMWLTCQSGSSIIQVVTTKLDGSAASETHTTGGGSTWSGDATGDTILQAATVVTLRTGFRGKSFRGRIYLPFVGDQVLSDGIFTSGTITAMQTAWETFRAAMKTAGFPIHVCSRLHSSSVETSSETVQPNCKTQRRRVRR